MERCPFTFVSIKKKIFATPYSRIYFQYTFIQFAFHFFSIQFNLNPIEPNFNSNAYSIQVAMQWYSIFSFKWNLVSTNSINFVLQLFNWSTLVMCNNAEPKFDLHEGKIYKIAIDTNPFVYWFLFTMRFVCLRWQKGPHHFFEVSSWQMTIYYY